MYIRREYRANSFLSIITKLQKNPKANVKKKNATRIHERINCPSNRKIRHILY